jgi:hypothetical protein
VKASVPAGLLLTLLIPLSSSLFVQVLQCMVAQAATTPVGHDPHFFCV